MKIFTILLLAKLTADHHEKFIHKTVKTDAWLLLKLGLVTIVPVFFIYKQPDLGTSLVFVAILLGIIFVSGITWKILIPIYSTATLFVGTVLYFAIYRPDLLKYVGIQKYQFKRIYSWLDPYTYKSDEGFQLVKSLLAVGSGQTTGKGLGHREVYMPESHTDFIFSTLAKNLALSVEVSSLVYFSCSFIKLRKRA